jgi:hypothetical protein
MRLRIRMFAWAAVVGGLSCGCHQVTGVDAYSKDPLLASKKPVEGTPGEATAVTQLAQAEPPAPAAPAMAVVTASRPHEPFATGRADVIAQPAARERGPTVAMPALRSTPLPGNSSVYGHAPDHSWLLGVVDKHYAGHIELRYCDASEDDSWGGKVALENDPRLAQFHDGDVIRVEGDLLPVDPSQRDTWSHYPHYRIRDVKLIQPKS